ncbi:hypothetical protein BTN50_0749 [Candidatus Enterovibrio altilux]|uniref:Uncharacterized protein n=1 Tax=Candidatus Enterovibrio altilux TaxID=1927128 RepID=A0A291B8F6_9GAMM|nr:hypothetical protein BTN50_0749 [Candidatus Enterovibrio luxaltus]
MPLNVTCARFTVSFQCHSFLYFLFIFIIGFEPYKINGHVLDSSFMFRLERDVNRFGLIANA